MIDACYIADFYCDNKTGEMSHDLEIVRLGLQLTGETWRDVCREAKKRGWLIDRTRTFAVCPQCVRTGVRISQVRGIER